MSWDYCRCRRRAVRAQTASGGFSSIVTNQMLVPELWKISTLRRARAWLPNRKRRERPGVKTRFLTLIGQKSPNFLAALSATGIRQLAAGGKARAFGDIFSNELAELESRQFLNIAQSLLPFATDVSLDLIGEIFGIPRIAQQTATVDIGDQNFEWYVRNGTFGAINSGQDIVIPAGVSIYTAAGVNGPVYIANAVTCPAAASSMSFSATAFNSGAAGNAPAGILRLRISPVIPRACTARCW